jgi:hypothetical protein
MKRPINSAAFLSIGGFVGSHAPENEVGLFRDIRLAYSENFPAEPRIGDCDRRLSDAMEVGELLLCRLIRGVQVGCELKEGAGFTDALG